MFSNSVLNFFAFVQLFCSFRMRYPIVGGDRRCSSAVVLETDLLAEEIGGETDDSDGDLDGWLSESVEEIVLCWLLQWYLWIKLGSRNEEGEGQESRAFA